MRKSQTSQDQQNRSSCAGDGSWVDAFHDDYHKGCDPKFTWLREAARHVIRLEVPGFEKKHLLVLANMTSKLVIVIGEQPVKDGTPVKFKKTFKLEDDRYKMDKIRAKLWNGCLDIILPLKEPRQLSNSPAGETKWVVLGSVVIAVGAIVLGAFLVCRCYII
ncbi:hypothetical protein MLD38_030953 [Melastoma candidum]|uniref:Uncharacterized protein n=1 Tax=Melastoma candidum TaxID=119954 RepID=A0ACB9MN78_9MYRT|nr:hypothetical protein MLD38_030953 [Melastoma candidum]